MSRVQATHTMYPEPCAPLSYHTNSDEEETPTPYIGDRSDDLPREVINRDDESGRISTTSNTRTCKFMQSKDSQSRHTAIMVLDQDHRSQQPCLCLTTTSCATYVTLLTLIAALISVSHHALFLYSNQAALDK